MNILCTRIKPTGGERRLDLTDSPIFLIACNQRGTCHHYQLAGTDALATARRALEG
jgi:hypothetical protein